MTYYYIVVSVLNFGQVICQSHVQDSVPFSWQTFADMKLAVLFVTRGGGFTNKRKQLPQGTSCLLNLIWPLI